MTMIFVRNTYDVIMIALADLYLIKIIKGTYLDGAFCVSDP